MRTSVRTPIGGSVVVVLGAALVIVGAGFAAARTTTGPAWKQPLLLAGCETSDCTTAETSDPTKQAADAQAYFASFGHGCGAAVLGDAEQTGAGDPSTAEAYGGLADALDSGQIDHMVQSVRVLLENCEAHANDGLRNALYHHGVNWVRHHEHEVWLEQKFADKWADGKPGGGNPHAADAEPKDGDREKAESEEAGGGDEKVHGNPHDPGASSTPGASSGHGNAYGHAK
jgi:hypothetical protein